MSDSAVRIQVIEHQLSDVGGPLGRNLHFDPRSKGFRVTGPLADPDKLQSKLWRRWIRPFDQSRLGPQKNLELGCCTVVGGLGVLRTDPYNKLLSAQAKADMHDVVSLYSDETANDQYYGQYPPIDTGSSVLDFMKMAVRRKWITSYNWSMSHQEFATGIATIGPAEVGTYWKSGMDHPDEHGVVHPTGSNRGGHAYECLGRIWDVDEWFDVCCQSWGSTWPTRPACKRTAHFAIPEREFMNLLDDDGEVVFPVLT